MWLNNATIASYDQAAKFFATARNKVAGKPLRSWALLKQQGDDYVVHMKHWGAHASSEIGRFKPNNTFEFSMDIPTGRRFSVTLSQAMHGALPFWWNRKGTGRYEVSSIKHAVASNPNESNRWWEILRGIAVPYQEGLTFDLSTHLPTNAKPAETDTIVPEKRKEWLRAVRVFKRAIKTKARIGVVKGIVAQVAQKRTGVSRHDWIRPDWHADAWNDKLYTAVKNNDTSIEFMTLIVESTPYFTYRGLTDTDVLDYVEAIFREHSIGLRRRFGVFG